MEDLGVGFVRVCVCVWQETMHVEAHAHKGAG